MAAPLGFVGVVTLVMTLSWTDNPLLSMIPTYVQTHSVAQVAMSPTPQGNPEYDIIQINDSAIIADAQANGSHSIDVLPTSTKDAASSDFGDIQVVTPTPALYPTATPEVFAPQSDHPRKQPEPPAGQSGVVRVGQQIPVVDITPDVMADDAELSELVAPLFENHVAPTPLVIELEIPSNDGAMQGSAKLKPPGKSSVFPRVMLIPTPTPAPMDYTVAAALANVPSVEIVPALGVRFTPTPTLPPTPTPIPEPTTLWSDNGPVIGRLWSSFQPLSPENGDHFWLSNPFANVSVNHMASPSYQFGSTAGGRYRPHHGVDISNPHGTPVQAGVNGEVVFAGPDDPEVIGPYPNFYGNAIIIRLDRRLPVAGGRLDVYVLFGHLSEMNVEVGQRVEPDDVIGRVGMTGIAIGPHLHVEIRLGANSYSHNVNPYLWLKPMPGTGAVAVRLVTEDGKTWSGAKVSLARLQGGKAVWARQIETYLDVENFGPDPACGENGAMGDVPAGYYYLIGKVDGQTIRSEFEVRPGQTTFVEVHTE